MAANFESVSESTTFYIERAEDEFHAVGTNGVGDSFMPMPSRFEDAQPERLTPSAIDTKLQTSLLTGVLLLETDLAILTERTRLLTDSHYCVTTARSQSDLFLVRGKTGISLAILSDCLGAAALGVAAHSIRLGWPLARILILGKAQFVLEDNLYDEAIDHRLVKAELLLTVARICHPPVARGRDGGLFILRRGTTETDARTL
jgi:hypothetical protein